MLACVQGNCRFVCGPLHPCEQLSLEPVALLAEMWIVSVVGELIGKIEKAIPVVIP